MSYGCTLKIIAVLLTTNFGLTPFQILAHGLWLKTYRPKQMIQDSHFKDDTEHYLS